MLLVFAQNQMPIENQAETAYRTCIGAAGATLLTQEEAEALPGHTVSYEEACEKAEDDTVYVQTENGWELVATDLDTHNYYFRAEWDGGCYAEAFDAGGWDDSLNSGMNGVDNAIQTFKAKYPDISKAEMSLVTTDRATGAKSNSFMTWRRDNESSCYWD